MQRNGLSLRVAWQMNWRNGANPPNLKNYMLIATLSKGRGLVLFCHIRDSLADFGPRARLNWLGSVALRSPLGCSTLFAWGRIFPCPGVANESASPDCFAWRRWPPRPSRRQPPSAPLVASDPSLPRSSRTQHRKPCVWLPSNQRSQICSFARPPSASSCPRPPSSPQTDAHISTASARPGEQFTATLTRRLRCKDAPSSPPEPP